MRAVACQHAELSLLDLPEPVPAPGQVRIEVLRCGICGSDLHARHGLDSWAEMAARAGYGRFGRSEQQVVFGHEFCGQVAEHGPRCRRREPEGTPVVALTLLRSSEGIDTIGLSTHAPGARVSASALTTRSPVHERPGASESMRIGRVAGSPGPKATSPAGPRRT